MQTHFGRDGMQRRLRRTSELSPLTEKHLAPPQQLARYPILVCAFLLEGLELETTLPLGEDDYIGPQPL